MQADLFGDDQAETCFFERLEDAVSNPEIPCCFVTPNLPPCLEHWELHRKAKTNSISLLVTNSIKICIFLFIDKFFLIYLFLILPIQNVLGTFKPRLVSLKD